MASPLQVKVPQDVRDYKEKIIGNMSGRQLIFGGIAAAIGVVVCVVAYFVLKMPVDAFGWIIMVVDAPILAFGWYRPMGLNFETYLKYRLDFQSAPKQLVYENDKEVSMNVHTNRKKIREYDDE